MGTTATVTGHPWQKTVIWIIVIICLFESVTKGWSSLLALPLAVVGLPVFVFIQYRALNYGGGRLAVPVGAVSALLAMCVLAFFVALPGVDDSDRWLLFGFYTAQNDTAIAQISERVSEIAFYAAPALLLLLGGLLIANDRPPKTKA